MHPKLLERRLLAIRARDRMMRAFFSGPIKCTLYGSQGCHHGVAAIGKNSEQSVRLRFSIAI
jgi:hypothetical protein